MSDPPAEKRQRRTIEAATRLSPLRIAGGPTTTQHVRPPAPNATYVAVAAAIVLLAAMLATAFERNLVGTLTQHGWGRTLQGVGAALTQLTCGTGGFVIDRRVDAVLQTGGFTGNLKLLGDLGETYPQGLQNQQRLQGALDAAQLVNCTVPAAPNAAGHFPQLIGFGGEDAGMSSYTLFAFAIIGINVPALTYAYFVILLVSLGLFTFSHGRSSGAMVAGGLLAVALYLAFSSALCSFTMPAEFGSQPGIDIKDPRFLGTIAALPMLHVIVTWMRMDYRLVLRDYVVLAGQMAILAFALHLRWPVVWTLLALPFLWSVCVAATIYRSRGSILCFGHWRSPRSLFVLVMVCAIPCALQIVVDYSQHPFYAAEGDLGRHTFWDGVLQSLEYNPEWKAKYAASVNGATGDELSIAAVGMAIAQLPPDQRDRYLNGDGNPTRLAFEKFSQSTFLGILLRDPTFVLHTFFVTKPLLLLSTEKIMYRSLFGTLKGWHLLIPIIALVALAWVAARDAGCLKLLCRIATATSLCALLACLPNWLVTVNELVMFDNFTWGLLLICLAPVILAATLGRLAQFARASSPGALPIWRGNRGPRATSKRMRLPG
jgi:hypothetical protein